MNICNYVKLKADKSTVDIWIKNRNNPILEMNQSKVSDWDDVLN